jgi:3-hydroxyisobutyrate dehydrogenase-like beta-hydroxyacid dehydrogenase
MPSPTGNEIVVVGIGAMGGGMARALLASPVAQIVRGYDRSVDAMEKFLEDAIKANKAGRPQGQGKQEPSELLVPRTTLSEAITETTDFVILSLVNESQCDHVCFGSREPNLVAILPEGSCVILTSTVSGKHQHPHTPDTHSNVRYENEGMNRIANNSCFPP